MVIWEKGLKKIAQQFYDFIYTFEYLTLFGRHEMIRFSKLVMISMIVVCFASAALAGVKSGDTAMNQKKYRDAIKQYDAYLKKNPKDDAVIVKIALAYEGAKWYGQSVQWWDKYIKQFPKGDDINTAKKHSAENHRWLGVNFYNNLGESPAIALDHLNKAIDLDPTLLDAYIWKARIFMSEGNFQPAADTLDDASKIAPDNKLVAWMHKVAVGKYKNGGVAYDKYQQGVLLYEKDDKAGALEQFRGAVTNNPNFSAAHLWAARVLFEQGAFADSITEWQTVLKLEPDNARAAWFLKQAQQALAKSGGKQ
jgi:tetratricopeptide (TPR) repeat protein